MAGTPPKPPPPTLASGSSSSPKPPRTLAARSSASPKPPPTLAAGSTSSPMPPPTLAAGSSSSPKPPPTLATGSSSSPEPPPPFWHPSYKELVDSYLRPRVVSRTKPNFIHEADLYSADPDVLTGAHDAATSSNGARAWYFFTPLHLKRSAKKDQMKRNVDTGREGTWVGYGSPMDVLSDGKKIGTRRAFTFDEKVDGKLVKSAWRMMEFRLNPNEGGQEAGSSDLLALCKVYPDPNAKAEDGEDPAASATAVMPGREGEGADEEIAAETAAGPVLKKRKAGDKDSGAETVASSPGRQNKADGESKSADAATTGEIFADGKDPFDAPEEAEQEEPGVRRDIRFYDFMGVSSAPLDATDEAEQEPRDPRDPPFYDFLSDSQNPKKQ